MSSSTPPQGEALPSANLPSDVPEAPADAPADTSADALTVAPVDATIGASASATTDAPRAAATPERARVDVAAVAARLKQQFPALFTGGAKPLKLRIQSDIQQRAPGQFTKAELSAFLRRYTGGTGYLIALSRAKERFDLDGQSAGELSEEHRLAAQQELTRRRETTDQRRAEEDRARQDRAQLLRDFSQTTLTPANFCALKGLTQEQLDAQLALAREEATQQPARPERNDQRRGDPRRAGPRPEGGRGGPRTDGARPPRRGGQGRPNDGGRPPRQPR